MIYEARAPSNIAFVKYWGKADPSKQWPANDSLSMTLSSAYTKTSACMIQHASRDEVWLEQEKLSYSNSFAQKVVTHLDLLRAQTSRSAFLRIQTINSFPKSCGIASSASGFAALTVAGLAAFLEVKNLEELKNQVTEKTLTDLMRLGSGSACRSFHDGFVLWEKGPSHDLQSVKCLFPKDHWKLCDIVVMVSKLPKKISSSKAHLLAYSSPFFSTRLAGLKEKRFMMEQAIAKKDLTLLGPLLEQEALEMHSIIMTSKQPMSYLREDSFELLVWIRQKRQEGHFKAYFTIDAGPNIHVICEEQDKALFLEHLKKDFPKTDYLEDQIGSGLELKII